MNLPIAAVVREAIVAYDEGRYGDANRLFAQASTVSAGDDLRVLNGLYLTHWKLRHQAEAKNAFGRLVGSGLNNKKLAMKFLFAPGGTSFIADRDIQAQYTFWLQEIARQTATQGACMKVVGHTSKTGGAEVNARLSLQRAEFVRERLSNNAATLRNRIAPVGAGFSQNLIGLGTDDARDALDRRVEFQVVECSQL